MLEQSVENELFQEAFLSSATDYVERSNSHAITMEGNRVVISGELIQAAVETDDTLVLTLEGSYDGQVWKTSGLGSLSFDLKTELAPLTKSSSAIDDVDYTYIRLRAELSDNDAGGDLSVLFSASVVCSEQ